MRQIEGEFDLFSNIVPLIDNSFIFLLKFMKKGGNKSEAYN